jgi:transcriptional regulator with XRE-family HTH domain
MEKCYLCGNDMQIIKDKPYKYNECGLDVTLFGITQYHCPDCNESYASIPNMQKLHRVIGAHICKKRNKAKDLAQALGVTASTVSRWENGKKEIGEAHDRLLRSIYMMYTSEQSNHIICDGVINLFKELPAKRKKIKQPGTISLNPQEWLSCMGESCLA